MAEVFPQGKAVVAAAAMALSSVSVTANALRLRTASFDRGCAFA
ncbi:MAG: hypothetical protein V4787_05435 [Pseudomonadota bacterium]